MRKFKYIILSLGLIAFMLNSCNKEKQNQIVQNTDGKVSWTKEDLRIQNNILGFQDKIKNNTFKNGETLELDSAVWYLEALLNYNYSNPDSSFVNLTVDTTFEFNLVVNNNMVNYENVAEAAFAMEEHIVGFLNAMPNTIKFLVAADVSIKPDEFKDGTKTLTIVSGYGSEYIDNPAAYTPFGENDYWLYGFDLGGCGTNTATNSDAAKEIQYKINNPNYQLIDPYVAGSYVVNVGIEDVAAWEYENTDDPGSDDNWLDYLMYLEVTNNILTADQCLEPTEMNFYLQGTLNVIDIVIADKQLLYTDDNIEFVYLLLDGQMASFQDIITYYHTAEITYGKRVIKATPTE